MLHIDPDSQRELHHHKENQMKKTMTMKDLQRATGAPKYTIIYLRENGRLQIVKESLGRGYPNLYHPDSIEIVQSHLSKAREQNEQPIGNR